MISKRLIQAKEKIENGKLYKISEAIELVKETSKVKFDASVEVHVKLNIDPKKSDQIIRGSVILPNGTGKKIRVVAFVLEDQIDQAKKFGADIAGSDDLINKIKKTNKTDFDIAVTTPDMMKNLSVIARILGQKGLMPNIKTGTISSNLEKMIGELKKGKITYKNDDTANIHVIIGKVSFESKLLVENFNIFIEALKKTKPGTLKGSFIKNMTITSSMGPGIKIEFN